MRIYTKTGDDGTTGLYGGGRVSKTEPRIAAIGDVDELNAALGLAAALGAPPFDPPLQTIQNRLFDLGAELASPAKPIEVLSEHDIEALENGIDAMDGTIEVLRSFILPGGTSPAAALHLARAVCRRAERSVLQLASEAYVRSIITTYLNRLSDWLFTAARTANHTSSVEDIKWTTRD